MSPEEIRDFQAKYEIIMSLMSPIPHTIIDAVKEKFQDIRSNNTEKAEASQIDMLRKIVQIDMAQVGTQAIEFSSYLKNKNNELIKVGREHGENSNEYNELGAEMKAYSISAIQDMVDRTGNVIKQLCGDDSSIKIAKKRILAKQYNDLRNAAVTHFGIHPLGGCIELS